MHPKRSIFLLCSSVTTGFLLPNPSGKYNIDLTTGTLTDYGHGGRELLLSVFQPATCASTVPVLYMPNTTAEVQGAYLQKDLNASANFTPLFEGARLPVCPDESRRYSPDRDYPILLFGSGWAIPRLYYSALASAIASEGFVVITMDHPGETNVITYPDGHVVYGTDPSRPTVEDFTNYTMDRVADASFIIDQLSNATAIASLLPRRGPRPFRTDQIGMLGHSLGGNAAVFAASHDSRIRGAVVWDGTLFGTLPASGLSTPVLYMEEQIVGNARDPSWVTAWPQLTGPKLWVEVINATHETFSDGPILLQAAGQDPAAFAGLLGTISSTEIVKILVAYTTAWMEGAFHDKIGGALLEGKEPGRFPEVEVLEKSGY